ncbi:GNAT family N-acetyltransferase [Proteiniphilum saccharofermentans]|uniref:GNAT family N-acetyltransferase n=1 Tax=Proteiniphilum saccharofermentans TaxID=1642647 RepID=UPI0028AB7D7D|nr:GNAT family N-acetyltransferase [Proteiniphilum saccharofermentans]
MATFYKKTKVAKGGSNFTTKININKRIMEYRKILELEFREFSREVLEKSWEWLNDPQIRALTSTPDFDRESQEKWFENLKNRKDYFIRSIWHKDKPIAVMGIKHLTGKDGEVFGYIGEKEYWGKTVGIQGLEFMVNYAKSLNLESLYATVLKENINSYKLNRRLGFEKEKDIDENTILMRLYLSTLE